MKKLTKEEFEDRMMAFNEAEKIFVGSGITNNITVAFQIYQAILADKERAKHAAPSEHGFLPGSPMNGFERPKCPECNSDMLFRAIPENEEGVKTQLVCRKIDCPVVLDSDKTIEQWKEILAVRDGKLS